MRNTVTIALKEFSANLNNIRFLLLFSIFLLMLLLAAYQGAQEYQNELRGYNEMMKDLSGKGMDTPKPSILNAFVHLIEGISVIGAIIGIAIGFDTISGERERGTLGFLLTQPIYRDTVINGKLLGFSFLVGTVVLISSLLCMGIILSVTGVYPSEGDIIRIIVFLLSSFLYILTFVIIGVFFSVVLKDSVNSLLASVAVFIVSTLLITSIGSVIASIFAPISMYTFGSSGEDFEKAWRSNRDILEKISYISPTENFKIINQVSLNPYFERNEGYGFGKQIEHTISESLGMVWSNVVAILTILILFFISSYVMFLRQDLS